MDTLSDDLRRLSGLAPDGPPPPDLWSRGRRRRRRRQGGAVLAAVALVAGAVTLAPTVDLTSPDPQTLSPVEDARLPDKVFRPDADAPGTDDEPIGRLAAIGTALRHGDPGRTTLDDLTRRPGLTYPEGYRAVFGISASDGSYRWLDIDASIDPGSCDLSSQGDLVACVRLAVDDPTPAQVMGNGIVFFDPATGRSRAVPFPEPRMTYEWSTQLPRAPFSRDGRSLLAQLGVDVDELSPPLYELDVSTGRWQRLTGNPRWVPIYGSAPRGVLWSDTDQVWTRVGSACPRAVPIPRRFSELHVSPDGRTVIAQGPDGAVVADWPLTSRSRWRGVAGGLSWNRFLGWQDSTRVVVVAVGGDEDPPPTVIDTAAGRIVGRAEIPPGERFGILWAAGLLGADVVPGERPPSYLSTAQKARRAGAAAGLVLVAAGGLWVRRRVKRG